MLFAVASAISDFSHHIDLSVEKARMLASVRYGDNSGLQRLVAAGLVDHARNPHRVLEQYPARRLLRFSG